MFNYPDIFMTTKLFHSADISELLPGDDEDDARNDTQRESGAHGTENRSRC